MTDRALVDAAAPAPTPAEVERVFREIRDRAMADVPILNHALDVAAVGFTDWAGYRLGVLVTPWFMSLVLFPGRNPAWPGLAVGGSRSFRFPAGGLDFLLGEQEALGRYLACSLFSPVLEFEDQAAAVATAEAVMTALFEDPAVAPGAGAPPPAAGAEVPAGPMTRRDFLRGGGDRAAPGGGR